MAEKAATTGRFLHRKMAEYEALRAEIEGLKIESAETAERAASEPNVR